MVLTYHSLDDSGSPISIGPDVFRSHVQWLVATKQRVVPVHELAALPADTDAISLTFDDGFSSFAAIAAPLLADAALPATIFVVTDRPGLTNEWSAAHDDKVPVLPLMRWDEIESIANGGFDIGAHTRTHVHLPKVNDAARLADEIVGSATAIEQRIGIRPRSFAYPYGEVSDQAAEVVRSTYDYGCTTAMRTIGSEDDPARLPRLDAYYFRRAGLLESWGTRRFARYVRMRAFGRQVRQTVTGLAGAA